MKASAASSSSSDSLSRFWISACLPFSRSSIWSRRMSSARGGRVGRERRLDEEGLSR